MHNTICLLLCWKRTIRSMPGEMLAAFSSSNDSSELVDAAEQLMSVSKYLSDTRASVRGIVGSKHEMMQ